MSTHLNHDASRKIAQYLNGKANSKPLRGRYTNDMLGVKYCCKQVNYAQADIALKYASRNIAIVPTDILSTGMGWQMSCSTIDMGSMYLPSIPVAKNNNIAQYVQGISQIKHCAMFQGHFIDG